MDHDDGFSRWKVSFSPLMCSSPFSRVMMSDHEDTSSATSWGLEEVRCRREREGTA